MSASVHYDAPPTLARFMDSDAFVRAVVGPVGSGKSSCCVIEILRRASEQAPGPDGVRRTRWAVIRNTYPELRDTTRKTFEQWVPARLGRWHEREFAFEIDAPLPDGTRLHSDVLFRALDRPDDVKKLLSLELTGAYVNEAREVPRDVVDMLQTRVGRFPAMRDGGATWFGCWMDTNPWAVGSWGHELFSVQRPEGFALFEQPDGMGPAAENVENLPPGYYPRLCTGKDEEWVDEYVRGKYPKADKGSIFGKWLAALDERGGVADFPHPRDGVFATFDLGVSDSTAIWWWRIGRHGVPDVLDWYEASGEGASHYFEVLDGRGYKLQRIWLPHDARARSFQTGRSTLEQFAERYGIGMLALTPELSVADGISAARWLLEQPVRFHTRCSEGLKRLRAYRYQWDETKKVYSRQPLHDASSHSSDAWRYVACAVHSSELLARPPQQAAAVPLRGAENMTLDEAWASAPKPRRQRA